MEWLIDKTTFIEVQREFKKIERKLLMDTKGNIIGIDSWDVEKVEKTTKSLFGKKKTQTFYKIKTITFVDGKDRKAYEWSEKSGLICTEMGIGKLLEDRKRFVMMKEQLKNIGFNIVKLPRKKKNDEK